VYLYLYVIALCLLVVPQSLNLLLLTCSCSWSLLWHCQKYPGFIMSLWHFQVGINCLLLWMNSAVNVNLTKWCSWPFDAYCCHMDTAIKNPVPDRVKSLFVIFDIRALWRSGLNPVWHRMLYSSKHIVTVSIEGLNKKKRGCRACERIGQRSGAGIPEISGAWMEEPVTRAVERERNGERVGEGDQRDTVEQWAQITPLSSANMLC